MACVAEGWIWQGRRYDIESKGRRGDLFLLRARYALAEATPGTKDDPIINGLKHITAEWPSLRDAWFTTVDAVLLDPAENSETYFFSGARYVHVKIIPGTVGDYIIYGPKSIIAQWPPLHEVGAHLPDAIHL